MGILEKDVELYLVKEVRKLNGKAFKVQSPGNNGFPDRLIVFPGNRMILAEIKRPGQKPRALQMRMIVFLRMLSIEVLVIDCKKQVDAFCEVMRKEIYDDAGNVK